MSRRATPSTETAGPARSAPGRAPSAAGRGGPGGPAGLLALQRLAGNGAVAGMLGRAGNGGGPEAAPGVPAGAAPAGPDTTAAVGGAAGAGGGAGAGGAGGGGSLAPSTFGAGLSGFAALVESATAQAAGSGAALLAAPAAVRGPDQAGPPTLPEPPAPAPAPAAPAPAPPAGGDAAVDVAATTAGIGEHSAAVATGVAVGTSSAAAAAAALPPPAVGATAAPAPVAAPTAPVPPAIPAPAIAGLPQLEPEVAQVLDTGFGPKLAARADEARAQHADAVGKHAALVDTARSTHEAAVAQHQAAADQETAAVRAGANRQVGAATSAWSAETGAAGAEARAQLQTARSAAAAEVAAQAGQGNAQAARIVQDAQKQAQTQPDPAPPSGTGVQRSLWESVKGAAGGLVSAAKSGLSTLAGAARGLVEAALSRARSVLDGARSAIRDRVARFTEAARAVAERVRSRLAQAARTALGAVRSAVAAARAALDGVVARVRALGARLVAGLLDRVRRAGAWLAEKGKAIVGGLVAAGKKVLDLAGKVRQLLAVTGNKMLTGVVQIIEDPAAFVRPYIAEVGKMIAAVPGKAAGLYDQHVAPLFGGGAAPAPTATATVQRQPTPAPATDPGAPVAQPGRGAIIKELLGQRLSYLAGNWGSVILNALLEIFVPFVSVYRHLPAAMKAVWQALKDLWAGNVSDAIDQGLKAARELMAILGSLFALFSIIAWIAGSIFGTPIIGEAAMFAIGMSVLAMDLAIQLASIWAAAANLGHPGRTVPQLEDDYNNIADSIFSLAITVALILIAVVGQKLGKVLLARFPRVAGALEGIMSRLRRAARRNQPVVDVPTVKPVAPPATEFPGRAGLTPGEQAAFDRFIASQRANNKLTPEFEAKLKSSTPDQLRKIAAKEIAAQPDVEDRQAAADRAKATNASDPYDPVMANTEDQGGNVKIRWNEVRPTDGEIAQAKQLAAQTGEPVELYGDGYRGIDGNINKRPLQIKSIPAGDPPLRGPGGVRRSAEIARTKAIRDGFGNVEVQLEAQGMTRAEVAAEFAKPNASGIYLDGTGVSKVVVHCSDGVYTPPPQGRPATPLPGPIHVDDDKAGDRQKADAGTRE